MYFKDKKIIFAIIIIIVIFIGITFSIYHETTRVSQEPNQEGNNTEQAEEYLKQIDLVLFNKDKSIKWNLDSEKLKREDDGNIYDMSEPNFKAFEDEKLIYTGKGRKAAYNNKQEVISLSGSIKINKDELLLETNTIIWDQSNDTIRGEQGVTLTSSDLIITAERFSGPLSLNKLTFYGTENSQAKVEWR
ncbi:MAG TPA: LPS export ABC transporter periplasmic protein LptC [Halanaerobiales bacterium]|nr:LPS export ABC transporter periplasmic protein LptC [Halanaerobiales bacterium]